MPIPQAEGEQSYLIERWSLNGFQYATLAATPLYAINAIRRGRFSIRGLVRYNWVIPLLGAGAGGAGALTVTSRESAATTASRTISMRMNKSTIRQDDMQLVGSVVGALLVPAFFCESFLCPTKARVLAHQIIVVGRAGLINGMLGGAGLGGAGGIITHLIKDDGALDDLKKQGNKAFREGKNATEEARRIGKDFTEEAREKGKELTDEARGKGRELSAEARQKGSELVERTK